MLRQFLVVYRMFDLLYIDISLKVSKCTYRQVAYLGGFFCLASPLFNHHHFVVLCAVLFVIYWYCEKPGRHALVPLASSSLSLTLCHIPKVDKHTRHTGTRYGAVYAQTSMGGTAAQWG